MGSEDLPADDVAGPKVFISYRRSDTEGTAERLSSMLRNDLGSRNVFRDRDDMILGQPWREALAKAMSYADAALFLVGPDWEGETGSGRRIDDEDDEVRREVIDALRADVRASPLPLVIDRASAPEHLPDEIKPLFEIPHFESASQEDLTSASTAAYQSVLVGIWAALARLVPHGVIILGESSKMVELDSLVEELSEAGALDSQTLSRFASGVYVASWRDVTKLQSDFPGLVVLSTGDPSEILKARLAAFASLSPGTAVVATGAGATALVAAGHSLGFGSSTSSGTLVQASTSELIGTAANTSMTSSGGISGWWASAGTGAKVATATATACVAIAVGSALVVANAGHDSGSAVENSEAVQADGRIYRAEQWADGASRMQLSNDVEGLRRNPENLAGPPDYEGSEVIDDPDSYLAIGDAVFECEFYVVVEFTDNRLIDGEGPDLKIFELGPPAEPVDAFAIMPTGSEKRLTDVKATAVNSVLVTYELDLAGNVGDEEVSEVKLCDRPGDDSGEPWPGADLDAVVAIHSVDA